MSEDSRDAAVVGSLGESLFLRRLSGTEEVGGLFEYTLEMLGSDESLAFADILGQKLGVRIALPDGGERHVNGFATRFAQLGRSGRYAVFEARLRPWLWYLTRSTDCRIFQAQSVPDIVQAVFREHGFSDFEDALGGSYPTREYCVQYRESDFAFVSRLLEQEGIYYFFRHESGRHVLVLADGYGAHEPEAGYERVPYYPPGNEADRERDHISDWQTAQEIQSELYALRDFDFEKPRAQLDAKETIEREHGAESYEVYDYPGNYLNTDEGQRYAAVRMEEQQAHFERVQGAGNARGLQAGRLFRMEGYPREDQNREYLITGLSMELFANDYETGSMAEGTTFNCSFTAADSQQPFRPVRRTPRPTVHGPQTAVVVGKSGEEIWTDKYGRVKLQFHWDRNGGADENSSCWVRVASVWAGRKWGGIHIPRIGQEVIVDFLEGDPDRPIVTGRVYNADNMPPYELPAEKTRSGIKSRSTKGGSAENFNELRFEDSKGDEHVFLHAEKDLRERVKNNHSESVAGSKFTNVGATYNLTVGDDGGEEAESESWTKAVESAIKSGLQTVGSWIGTALGPEPVTDPISTRRVHGDEEIQIDGKQKMSVGGTDSLVCKANSTKLVLGIKQDHFIGASASTFQGLSFTEKISGSVEVGASFKRDFVKGIKEQKAGQWNVTAKKGANLTTESDAIEFESADDFYVNAKKNAQVLAQDNITVDAKGGDLTLNAKSAKLQQEASSWKAKAGNLTLQTNGGAKVSMVGGSIGVTGSVIKLG
ncbi:type VI secretion system tip protein VgrG [Ectothiorhodospiraceae bacterium WFHF3C12]|nr:type VI secretion system tip protein VgrG [Ectothiorhodospiraceae bacterium WFHF3C12]